MNTYQIIENLEFKIKTLKEKTKKSRLILMISLCLAIFFLIGGIITFIIYLINKEQILLIFAIIFLALTLVAASLCLTNYYFVKDDLKNLKILNESLKNWKNKKPFISGGPLREINKKEE